jgi:hypothetical protein
MHFNPVGGRVRILKAIVDELPECCADCSQLSLRTMEDAWPHACGLTDSDVMETEGKKPDDCPLSLQKER